MQVTQVTYQAVWGGWLLVQQGSKYRYAKETPPCMVRFSTPGEACTFMQQLQDYVQQWYNIGAGVPCWHAKLLHLQQYSRLCVCCL
jgi:hypothetical protein